MALVGPSRLGPGQAPLAEEVGSLVVSEGEPPGAQPEPRGQSRRTLPRAWTVMTVYSKDHKSAEATFEIWKLTFCV